MKRINDPGPVAITNIHDEPIMETVDDPGDPSRKIQRPIVMRLGRFLLDRIADQKFVEGKQGADAIEFIIAAKAEIKAQTAEAEARGYWLIEDDRAAAIRSSGLSPTGGYIPQIMASLAPLVRAIRDMQTYRPEPPAAAPALALPPKDEEKAA